MDRRGKLILIVAAFGLIGLLGSVGCKSVCDKFADKTRECFEEVCSGDDAPPQCEPIGRMLEQSSDVDYECEGELKADAEAGMEKSCNELLGIPAAE